MAKNGFFKSGESMAVVRLMMPYLGKYPVLLAVGIVGTIINALFSFAIGLAIQHIVDSLPTGAKEGFEYLNSILLAALTAIVVITTSTFLTGYCLLLVFTRVTRDLRNNVFSSLIRQKVSYLERH